MLLETIKCENGKLFNLEFHQARCNEARKELGFNKPLILKNEIVIPENCKTGIFRCRVIYASEIIKVEFLPHSFRLIKSLKLVFDDEIDYHLKYSDRKNLENLFSKKENCDDIIIVKNGFITDTFTANIVLFDGKKWWTPDSPLLPGTQRQKLINQKKINVCKIPYNELKNYKKVGLINAMWNLNNMPEILIENIKK